MGSRVIGGSKYIVPVHCTMIRAAKVRIQKTRQKKERPKRRKQCFGSMTFGGGSGSADPCL